MQNLACQIILTSKDESTKCVDFADALIIANTHYKKFNGRAMMGIGIATTTYQQVSKHAVKYYQDRDFLMLDIFSLSLEPFRSYFFKTS